MGLPVTLNTIFLILCCIFLLLTFLLYELITRNRRRIMNNPLKLEEYDIESQIGVMIPEGHVAVYVLKQPDEKAIPYSWVMITGIDESPQEATVWMIYTRPSCRGKGHAKKLLKYLQTRYDKLTTNYERGLLNAPGVRLCISCGFDLKAQLFKN